MPTSPRSPFNQTRWTERDARIALAALERSGKPVSPFAAEHGLDAQRLYAWRRRLGGAGPTTFRELIVRPSHGIALSDGERAADGRLRIPGIVSTQIGPS
jgi:hypothetical protein